MVILGVDPGSIRCGFGILQVENTTVSVLNYGIIEPKRSSSSFNERLSVIYNEITSLIQSYLVTEAIFETQFYAKNPQSLMKLSQARTSAILSALNAKISVFEYSPRQVKLAVTGKGNATKKSVSYMISRLLNLDISKMKYDVADALAVAYCHIVRVHIQNPRSTSPRNWNEYIKKNPEKVIT